MNYSSVPLPESGEASDSFRPGSFAEDGMQLGTACGCALEERCRAVVQWYLERGRINMEESAAAGETVNDIFWDEFHQCAETILREQEEP